MPYVDRSHHCVFASLRLCLEAEHDAHHTATTTTTQCAISSIIYCIYSGYPHWSSQCSERVAQEEKAYGLAYCYLCGP